MSGQPSQIQQVLAAMHSPNQQAQQGAYAFLEKARNSAQQLGPFMEALTAELCNTANPPEIRQQAGIQLKNCLETRDEDETTRRLQAWRQFPQAMKNGIKQKVLACLGTEAQTQSSAALVISAIAQAEIPARNAEGMPANEWPALMGTLIGGASQPQTPEKARVAALQAVGYICDAIGNMGEDDQECLEKEANGILTGVTAAMDTANPPTVRMAAVTALHNALDFCNTQFENDRDRNHIMTIVCTMTRPPNSPELQVKSLQCINKIISLYYSKMEPYMKAALYGISLESIKNPDENVALQGIEFWSNVADVELDLIAGKADAERASTILDAEQIPKYYVQGAHQTLLPMLLQQMERQEEGEDPTEWGLSKAAHVCLKLVIETVKDIAVPPVVAYIGANLKDPAWQKRDTAVQAYGALLEGPKQETLLAFTKQALPSLLERIQDPQAEVRDSVAWVLGRLCDVLPDAVLGEALDPVCRCLMAGLQQEPRVALNCCWALGPLFEQGFAAAENTSGQSPPPTFKLKPYAQKFAEQLLVTAQRQDGDTDLHAAAYEALMVMNMNLPTDCYPILGFCWGQLSQRLGAAVQAMAAGQMAKEMLVEKATEQSHLCGCLTSIVRSMRKEDCASAGGQVMKLVLTMFGTQAAAENSVQEDALMLVGALSDQLQEAFEVYVPPVKGYLLHGIANSVEVETCKICIGVVGDLFRNLGQKADGSGSPMMKDTTEVMQALLQTFHKAGADETIKPHILSCFGDIAMAIGGVPFVTYAKQVMEAINQATVVAARSTAEEDFDVIDDTNDLRDGCLEAYVGILIALKGTAAQPHQNIQLFFPVCEHIIGFITACLQDTEVSDKVVGSAVGLVGDMIDTYKQTGPDGRPLATKFLSAQFCQGLMRMATQSEASEKLCPWVMQLMRKVGINPQ